MRCLAPVSPRNGHNCPLQGASHILSISIYSPLTIPCPGPIPLSTNPRVSEYVVITCKLFRCTSGRAQETDDFVDYLIRTIPHHFPLRQNKRQSTIPNTFPTIISPHTAPNLGLHARPTRQSPLRTLPSTSVLLSTVLNCSPTAPTPSPLTLSSPLPRRPFTNAKSFTAIPKTLRYGSSGSGASGPSSAALAPAGSVREGGLYVLFSYSCGDAGVRELWGKD